VYYVCRLLKTLVGGWEWCIGLPCEWVSWSLTSLFSTNTAISETKAYHVASGLVNRPPLFTTFIRRSSFRVQFVVYLYHQQRSNNEGVKWIIIAAALVNRQRYIICPLKNSDNIQCPAFGPRLVDVLANVNSRSTHLHVRYMLSTVHLSSVTLVHRLHPTQAVVIFGDIYMAFSTLATRSHPRKILRRSSQGNPSVGGVKHKRGSQMYSDCGPIEGYIVGNGAT